MRHQYGYDAGVEHEVEHGLPAAQVALEARSREVDVHQVLHVGPAPQRDAQHASHSAVCTIGRHKISAVYAACVTLDSRSRDHQLQNLSMYTHIALAQTKQ